MKKRFPTIPVASALAGLVSGLFGGGGGMVLVPLLGRTGLPQRKLYPTCVGVIFPVCLVSAAVHLLRGGAVLSSALPYLFGGAVGGLLGGMVYGRVPVVWMRRLFALFLLYAAARNLR